jgi:hypothetical protein
MLGFCNSNSQGLKGTVERVGLRVPILHGRLLIARTVAWVKLYSFVLSVSSVHTLVVFVVCKRRGWGEAPERSRRDRGYFAGMRSSGRQERRRRRPPQRATSS